MAEKLKSFDFNVPKKKGPKPVYHWDEWFDGDIWQLTHGEDFYIHPLMMERITRTRATTRGATVQMRHVGVPGKGRRKSDGYGLLILQRTDIVGPETAKAEARREKYRATRAANKMNGAKQPSKRRHPQASVD
jgi:hypothetical protein